MTTAPKPPVLKANPVNHGRILITSGIQHWLDTGCEPYEDEPRGELAQRWRNHYLRVIISSHINGDAGDTSPEDHQMNADAFANPGEGARVFTVWNRNKTSTIYAITQDYGGPDAYLTVMFASEY